MKVRIQQLNPTIGDISGNQQKILSALSEAYDTGIDLLILPEMCVCGYLPKDMLEYAAFRDAVYQANREIIEATRTTALIFGSITRNTKESGRLCFNTALMAQGGQKVAEVHKTLLPNYDVFDEARYFEPSESIECIEWQGRTLGVTICEDIWGNFNSQNTAYAVDPSRKLVESGADAIINISASPFRIDKSENRLDMLQSHVQELHRPIFYANQTGSNTSLVSDGDSMALTAEGRVIGRAPLFEEAFVDVKWNDENKKVEPVNNKTPAKLPSKNERIFGALKKGLADYIRKTNVTSDVVIGLSGGIDSSLVACIAAEALGADHVTGIAMPSEFSTDGSLDDAEQLAENLGIEMEQIPIKPIYQIYLNELEQIWGKTEFGNAEENLQARIRGILLMAIANKLNRFVLNTGNKSEAAVGYCTLYGDTNGALAVISDLYKTEVYELSSWLNEQYYKDEIIPNEILEKPPSAELRPDQKDSDSLPEYDILDPILKLYLEKKQSPSTIIDQGFDEELVRKIVGLINQNEFKRTQLPPGIKIHNKAFGPGRRWPLVQKWNG